MKVLPFLTLALAAVVLLGGCLVVGHDGPGYHDYDHHDPAWGDGHHP